MKCHKYQKVYRRSEIFLSLTKLLMFVMLLGEMLSHNVFAQTWQTQTFDTKTSYDIYLDVGDQVTVIKDVTLVRFEQIGSDYFLVVKNHGFNLKDQDGFISMASVVAILPENNNLNLRPSTKSRIKF